MDKPFINGKRFEMTRQCYVDHQNKIVVYWSPKAGCTSIVDMFAKGVLADRWEFVGQKYTRKDIENYGYYLNYMQSYQLLKSNPDYKSIVMLRDPYDRAICGFVEKFVRHSSGKPITNVDDMEPFAKRTYMQI